MPTTPNYGLVLPDYGDQQDVAVLDANFTTIDGQLKTNSDAATLGGWVAYTPSISGLTLGNATVAALKRKKQNNVDVKGLITLGSTSVVTAALVLNLTDSPSADGILQGLLIMRDASPVTYVAGQLINLSAVGQNSVSLYSAVAGAANPNYTAVSATSPFTWAAGDIIMYSISYKVD